MTKFIALLPFLFLSVAAHADSADRTIVVKFENLVPDFAALELALADSGSFLSALEEYSGDDGGSPQTGFGTWVVHGPVTAVKGGYIGKNLECRFGSETFYCDGRIVIETGASRIYTGMFLKSESVPIIRIIPEWADAIRGNLATLSPGRLRAGIVRSADGEGDSRVHRFEALWKSNGGYLTNDTSLVMSLFLSKIMQGAPYPFRSDTRPDSWRVLSSTVALRYFPRYYTPEIAMIKFGNSDSLQEMIATFEIVIEVPRKTLFLKTPHRYTLKIEGLQLRLASERVGGPGSSTSIREAQ